MVWYGGGHWSHVGVKKGHDYCYHYLTDKIADIILLFFVFLYSFFTGWWAWWSYLDCSRRCLAKKGVVSERCVWLVKFLYFLLFYVNVFFSDRHCGSLLVCHIANESPDSAAADGICEPSLFVVGLAVVIALFLLFCCCCCGCFCFRRRETIRRSLMDDFWSWQFCVCYDTELMWWFFQLLSFMLDHHLPSHLCCNYDLKCCLMNCN